MGHFEKPKDFKGTAVKLVRYMSHYKFRLLGILVCAAAGTVFNIIGPKILGNATSEIFEGFIRKVNGTGGIDFQSIERILLLLCLYITSAVFSIVQGWVMTGVSNRITYRLRNDISQKINRIPFKYFESRTHGEVLSRVTLGLEVTVLFRYDNALNAVCGKLRLCGGCAAWKLPYRKRCYPGGGHTGVYAVCKKFYASYPAGGPGD